MFAKTFAKDSASIIHGVGTDGKKIRAYYLSGSDISGYPEVFEGYEVEYIASSRAVAC